MTSPITHENIIEVLRVLRVRLGTAKDGDPNFTDRGNWLAAQFFVEKAIDDIESLIPKIEAARDLYQRLQAEKEGGETKPVLCIGLETLTLLARNKELNLENVALIPADSFPYALFAPPASGTDSSGRAFTGFTALPPPASSDWRMRLGLPPGPVTEDAVMAAYRAKVKDAHLDAEGNGDGLADLQSARDVGLKIARQQAKGIGT